MQIPYTIDLLVIVCIIVGVVITLIQHYADSGFVNIVTWLIGLGIGVGLAWVNWLHLYFLALIYLAIIVGALCITWVLLSEQTRNFLNKLMWKIPSEIKQQEKEMLVFLSTRWGYKFKPIHVKIALAVNAGCKNAKQIAKYMGEKNWIRIAAEVAHMSTEKGVDFTELKKFGQTFIT